MSFDAGVSSAGQLLIRLAEIDGFDQGWRIGDHVLSADPSQNMDPVRELQGPSVGSTPFSFVVAQSPPGVQGLHANRPSYMIKVAYDDADGHLSVDVSFLPALADLDRVRALLVALAEWWPLQHVSVAERFYAREDSPLDPVNRLGIGWAGWIPFPLEPAQLPEAGHLEPLGSGTFLASQNTYWEVTDRAAVQRAQDLELRLNALGLLPTRTVIKQGIWGDTP